MSWFQKKKQLTKNFFEEILKCYIFLRLKKSWIIFQSFFYFQNFLKVEIMFVCACHLLLDKMRNSKVTYESHQLVFNNFLFASEIVSFCVRPKVNYRFDNDIRSYVLKMLTKIICW